MPKKKTGAKATKKATKAGAKKKSAVKKKTSTAAKKKTATRAKTSTKATVAKKKTTNKKAVKKKLSKREREKYRVILDDKRRTLTSRYRAEVERSRGQASDGIEDYVDYAVSSYTKEFLLSLSDMERRQLLLVEEALRRIDRGDYGQCDECTELIGQKRLEAVPWARHCIRCQNLEEQGLLAHQSFREATAEPAGKGRGDGDEDH